MATLADVRNYLFDQLDEDVEQSQDMLRRVNGFISRAYVSLVKDVPFIPFEREIPFQLQPTVSSIDSTDVLVPTVPLVASVIPAEKSAYDATAQPDRDATTTLQTNLTYASSSFNTAWKYDRTWDARDIELLDSTTNAVLHRCKIGTITRDAQGDGDKDDDDRIFVVLTIPLDLTDATISAAAAAGFKYRIFTDEYYLPHKVVEWRSGRIVNQDVPWPLEVLGQSEAEKFWLQHEQDYADGGLPRYCFQRGWHQPLVAPQTAPTVLQATSDAYFSLNKWRGPEPPGQFSYVYTYTWGKRDTNSRTWNLAYQNWRGDLYEQSATTNNVYPPTASIPAKARVGEPLFESSPSPISDTITAAQIPTSTTNSSAVGMFFEPINYLMGYHGNVIAGDTTGSNNAFSGDTFNGLFIRIYRRRHSVDFTNYGTHGSKTEYTIRASNLDKATYPIDSGYYLLAEIPAEAWVDGNAPPWFLDDGNIIPDRQVRLPNRSGYRGVRFWPAPDAEYDIRLRALIRPEPLVNDRDPVLVPEDIIDLLIYRAMLYYADYQHNPRMRAQAEASYNRELDSARSRYGDFRPNDQVFVRGAVRSRQWRRNRGNWWTTGDTSS